MVAQVKGHQRMTSSPARNVWLSVDLTKSWIERRKKNTPLMYLAS